VNQPPELRESTDRYYTAYYRDTLGIPGWSALVRLRREEEVQERARRLARLEALLGADALQGRVLNVGCGTGGFNAAAAAAGVRVAGVDAGADAIAICALRPRVGLGFARAAAESRGKPYDEEGDTQMRAYVEGEIEAQSLALPMSGRLYDDGIIDPRDSRTVLGIALSAIHSEEVRGTMEWGVFRM